MRLKLKPKVNKYLQDIKFHNGSDIFFGDLETITAGTKYYQQYEATRPHFGYLMNAKTERGFLFRDYAELFKKLEGNYKDRNLIIYFHNLFFDGTFLLNFLNDNKKYQIVNKINFKAKQSQVSIFRKDNKIYRIKVYYAPHNNTFEFRCSYQLLNMSIESIGKIIDIPKMETDYDVEFEEDINNYPKEFIEYCQRDVEILCKGFKYFHELFLKNYNVDMLEAFTSGQMAYNNLMTDILIDHQGNIDTEDAFNNMNEFIKLNTDNGELGHNFYYGGFTQFANLPYQQSEVICHRGIKIDINSSYPFAMTLNLPYGEMYNGNETKPQHGEGHIKFYEIKIIYAKSKYPNINTMRNWHHADKLEFDDPEDFFNADIPEEYVSEIDNCKAYYMDLELEMMKRFNNMKYEIINTYWFRAKPYARNGINKMYQIKSDPKSPKALKQLAKLLMNSAYGKFGQNPLTTEYYICKDEAEYQEILKDPDITDDIGISWHYYKPAINDLTNYYVLKRRQLDHHPTKLLRHIGVAAAITSYARINLLMTLGNIGVENFLYCDTDSLILSNYDYRLNRFLNDVELGKGKDESKGHNGINKVGILGKKCYACFYNDGTEDYTFSGINEKTLDQYNEKEKQEIYSYKKTYIPNAVHKMVRAPKGGGLVLDKSDYYIKKRTH